MLKSLSLSAASLSIVLLMSAGSASAQTGRMVVTTPAGSAMQLIATGSAVHPFQIVTIWASPIYTGDDGGSKYGHDDGGQKGYGDGDKDGQYDGGHAPKPAPEPSTILSFGVALLVGGGVLLSRRLFGSRK